MADLGARAYRFSVSWSRVLPTGTGAINQPGLDFYQRLVDALLDAGVTPLINLFHWDLPQALQDRGGFANPEVVGWFTDYAVAGRVDPRRPGHGLDDVQRAGRLRLRRPCRRHPCAGPARLADGDPGGRQRAARSRRRQPGDPGSRPRREGRPGDRRQSGRARRPIRSEIASPPTSGAPLATRGSSIRSSVAATRRSDSRPTARRVTSTASSSTDPPAGDLDYLGLNYYRRDSVSAKSGPRVRLGDRGGGRLGADADGLARRARRPARRPARSPPDVRAARDRDHRERRRISRHGRSGRATSAMRPG